MLGLFLVKCNQKQGEEAGRLPGEKLGRGRHSISGRYFVLSTLQTLFTIYVYLFFFFLGRY